MQKIDIKNLSILTGVPAPSISRLKRKGANPTISTLEPLAVYFGVDIDTLLHTDMVNEDYKGPKKAFLDAKVYGLDQVSLQTRKPLDSLLVSGFDTDSDVFGVFIRSDSLAPVFNRGSVVLVDPNAVVQEGDYVLCTFGVHKAAVLRQIFFDGGRKMFFKPINPIYGEQSDGSYRVLGVVVKSIEQFR